VMGAENCSLDTSDVMDMALIQPRNTFNDSDYVSCPVGGQWWKCEDVNYPTFIGCCSTDPCSGQMCPDADLYAMGFGTVTSPTPDYPNHSCPYGGLWYTCADNSVPFQGCCDSNPCNGLGCPAADLKAAGVHTVITAESSTFTIPASVATATSSPKSAIDSGSSSASTSSSSNTAAIAGAAAAAAVVLTATIALICCWLIRRRTIRQVEGASVHNEMASHSPKPFYKEPLGPGTHKITAWVLSVVLTIAQSCPPYQNTSDAPTHSHTRPDCTLLPPHTSRRRAVTLRMTSRKKSWARVFRKMNSTDGLSPDRPITRRSPRSS
jgi:hypothetical protein